MDAGYTFFFLTAMDAGYTCHQNHKLSTFEKIRVIAYDGPYAVAIRVSVCLG